MAEKTVYIIDLNDKVTPKLKGVGNEAKKTDDIFSSIGGKLGSIFAGVSFAALGREMVQTTAKFQSLANAIKFSSDNAMAGKVSLAWLENFSQKYGVDLEAATEGFKTFQGAMIGTNFTSNQVRNMFEQVSKGSVTMGLSAESTTGVFLALGQIMGKGKVQAEELRGQIGERVPGAFGIAARAMDMSTQELDKFMSQGKLMAEDFLPKFAAEMEKTFGPGAEEASNSLASSLNRLSGAWDNLMKSFGNSDQGIMGTAFNMLSGFLNSLAEDYKTLDEVALKGAQGDISKRLNLTEAGFSSIAGQKGKSKEEIKNELLVSTKAQQDLLKMQLASVNKQLDSLATEMGYGWDGETINGKSGIPALKERVNQARINDKLGFVGAEKETLGFDLLKKQAELTGVISGIEAASEKTINKLFKPAMAAADAKTKKQTAGGISLTESRNGVTHITFNIDKFQNNEFNEGKNTAVPDDIQKFLDKMKAALSLAVNDAQIAANIG